LLLRLFVLFTIVPLVDLGLLLWIGQQTNWLVALALAFLPGLLGAYLVRWQGLRTWQRLQVQLASGQMPAAEILDGVMILVAGTLLITPGLLTDFTGLILLIPIVRSLVRRVLYRRFQVHVVTHGFASGVRPMSGDGVVDVEHWHAGDPVDRK
jgi:UPF0716 protein FxsA